MNLEQQEQYFDKMVIEMRTIMLNKGNDYSNSDRISNFKLAGSICGLTPELNCLSLIATKVARLGVLLKNESKPNNESIQDSILDLANYAVLLSMITADKPEEGQTFVYTGNELISISSNNNLPELKNVFLKQDENLKGAIPV